MAVASPSSSPRRSHSLDLPSLHPLDHSHPLLSPASTSTFDPDAFLLSRLPAPLSDLRDELRSYQAQLKSELVELINLDYREFVELGTGLKGEGKRLEKVRRPLNGIREDVAEVRESLKDSEDKLQDLLHERAELRDEKTLVQLLLSLTDSLSRTETLLSIAPPTAPPAASATSKPGQPSLSLVIGDASAKVDLSDSSEGQSMAAREKVVGRVAAEYTRVLYLSDKARKEGCALLTEVEWRIERIRNTLHRDLDHLFSETLSAIARSSSASHHEKETLTECLKTYALVEGWRDAEDLFKREIVRPMVRKLISADTLDTPIEPAVAPADHVPFTSILSPASPSSASPAGGVPPTPLTPSTPFFRTGNTPGIPSTPGVEKNPFDLAAPIHLNPRTVLPPAPRLEDSSSLGQLYNRLLAAFSKPEVTTVLHVASLLPSSNGCGTSAEASDDEDEGNDGRVVGKRGFEFFASVVWKEVGERLMDELGSLLFAAGRPSELHQHYTLSHSFFSLFESLAASPRSVFAMRQSPTYSTFQTRWGLGVYFQLRWKEIVLPLEEALTLSVAGSEKISSKDGLYLSQTRATLKALETSWNNDIFIPELAYRFWKLSLQVLSRYKGFTSSQIPSSTVAKSVNDTSTTDPAQTAEDDKKLRVATILLKEVNTFRHRAWDVWETRIESQIQRESDDGDGNSFNAGPENDPKDAYTLSLDALDTLQDPLSRSITSVLSKRCGESLRLVRSVVSQLRSATLKREPKEASYFVSGVFKPLRDYFDAERGGIGSVVQKEHGNRLRDAVVEEVARAYIAVLASVRESEEKLTQLRKRSKTTFSLFSSSSSAADEAKDAARVKTQMELDVVALQEDARSLGVDVESSPAIQDLLGAVRQDKGDSVA